MEHSGCIFSGLYSLYDSQYQRLNTISDEIAERVRMLGGFTIGSLQEFLEHTRLGEMSADVTHLLADYEATIRFLREDAKHCSEKYEDEGTFSFLVKVLRLQEKMAWMLRSYIDKE